MARFNDTLSRLLGNLDNAPDNLEDELTSAYAADIAEANDIAAARVQELEAERDEFSQTAQAMKAKNFDLLQKIPATGGIVSDDDDDESEADPYGNDFFGWE